LSIPLRPQFGSWLGWLVPDDRLLIFVIDADQDASDLVRQALTIGYDRLAGAIAGGIDAWRAAGFEVAATELVDVRRLDRPVVDVRQDDEHTRGHIPNSLHVELGDISEQDAELPDGELAVMCGHGERAATAASLLESAGRTNV